MPSFSDIVNLWPSAAELARDIGIGTVRARAWRNRNGIPAEMWPAVITAAKARGLMVDAEMLMQAAANRAQPAKAA
jgi:hypothetical protein